MAKAPVLKSIPMSLLMQQGKHNDKTKQQEEMARISGWLNVTRFALAGKYADQPEVKEIEALLENDEKALAMLDKAPYVDVSQPAQFAVIFRREQHMCPLLHDGEPYYFWRSMWTFDAATPPVCPVCVKTITADVITGYLAARGWQLTEQGWGMGNFGIAHDVLTLGKEQEALFLIAAAEGRIVEGLILDMMPPCPPGVPLTLIVSNDEVDAIVAAETAAAQRTPPTFVYEKHPMTQIRSSGFVAYQKAVEIGMDPAVIQRAAWRTSQPVIVPQAVVDAIDKSGGSRLLVGDICKMSGKIIRGQGMEGRKLDCGMCQQMVRILPFGIVEPHLVKSASKAPN